ncbi:MAG: hypothetical protein OHK0028_10610 [Deltaproteobacteria bacterium]
MKNFYKDHGVATILFVGEDPWSRDSLSTFFGIVGCRMRAASNAIEAVAALSAERFDLILCDHQLPGADGLVLLKKLGEMQPGAARILLTSYPAEKLAGSAVSSGVHEVIRKPFTMDTLEQSLTRCFPPADGAGREPVGTE